MERSIPIMFDELLGIQIILLARRLLKFSALKKVLSREIHLALNTPLRQDHRVELFARKNSMAMDTCPRF